MYTHWKLSLIMVVLEILLVRFRWDASRSKTNKILSVLGVAGRISRLPPTHSRFPVIRTRETLQQGGWFTLVKISTVTDSEEWLLLLLPLTRSFHVEKKKPTTVEIMHPSKLLHATSQVLQEDSTDNDSKHDCFVI